MDYKLIYDKAFSNESYNVHKDDEYRYLYCLNHIRNNDNIASIVDVGSGRGQVLRLIHQLNNQINLSSVDVSNFHNLDFVNFIKCDLSSSTDRSGLSKNKYDLSLCLDVLEHLDKSYIEEVFKMLSCIAPYSIISIANHSDKLNDVELHTIQEDFNYWYPILSKYFDMLDYSSFYIMEDGKIPLYILTLRSNNVISTNIQSVPKLLGYISKTPPIQLNKLNAKIDNLSENIYRCYETQNAALAKIAHDLAKIKERKYSIRRLIKNIKKEYKKRQNRKIFNDHFEE